MLYDVFICHAGEDKEDLVRPLALLLREARVSVWYDEFELRVGDSLRRAIDRGLTQSQFGIVVLSPAFFGKGWPQWELDGLLQRDLSQTGPLILPVWHGVGHAEVLAVSPPLADKLAVSSQEGPEHVAAELLKVLRPEGSTLLIARDILLAHGFTPPIVTDDWWLDVVEYAGSRVAYESWEFPLQSGDTPHERGHYIAWAAMQFEWTEVAREGRICQLTAPETVLEFIREMPGLSQACRNYPHFLALYAPQLTLEGFGAEFEGLFEEQANDILSRRGVEGAYDSELNFRLFPELESRASYLACQWVQGEVMGPHIRVLEPFEYICWILSKCSSWLPSTMHTVLLEGLKEWTVWPWTNVPADYNRDNWPTIGSLMRDLYDSAESGQLHVSSDGTEDLRNRMAVAADLVRAPEPINELLSAFTSTNVIERWFEVERSRFLARERGVAQPATE